MGGLLKRVLIFAAGIAVCAVVLTVVFAIASEMETSFEEEITHDADLYESQVRLSESIGCLFNL